MESMRASWLAAAAVMCLTPGAVPAQSYPAKPVRMIAPYPPGGSSDVVARLVSQKLADGLGRQVIVDNRPGAAANLGHEVAAKAPPDGYTLILTSAAALVTNQFLYKRLGWDPQNDFVPISIVAIASPVLVAHPAVPARNVKELVALAKARPGRLNFGTGGVGTTAHIVAEVFMTATGAKLNHVPYKGNVLAVSDTVGGQIDLTFADMVPAVPHIHTGRLRGLAVSSEQRSPVLPEVPTMAEAGVNAAFPQQWWGVAAPRGTPEAIVSRLNADVVQMMKGADLQEKFAAMGVFPASSTPARMQEMIKTGTSQMAKIVKAAGIQPE